MTEASAPPSDEPPPPPPPVEDRFILDESDLEEPPRSAQWFRDWWWSGTRAQRRTVTVALPLALLLSLGTWGALAYFRPEQPAQSQAATSTTPDRTTAEATSPSRAPTQTLTQIATVTTVLDGNTIEVLRAGETVTVRVIGIDAPDVAGSATGQQCWGTESTRFTSETLLQQEVGLVSDPTQGVTDESGATLAYVVLADGRDFSVLSAGAGQARSDTSGTPPTKAAEIAAAEQAARTSSLGLWGEPCNGGLAMPRPSVTPTPTATTTSQPEPAPPPPPPPPPLDPRFANCFQEARNAGYGPYVAGVDPEYGWYPDTDGDGIACERVGDG